MQSKSRVGSYRNAYNLYSLAIILIEIAVWGRIGKSFHITGIGKAGLDVLRDVQKELLGDPTYPDRVSE
ncbi:hypothetical protein K469DRAFT_703494 [Zopfia rhizophila CBS 207.26]|uniref:Uncharacterized protein n=1 Tax=Zopfia rhizophila CBS 207.26 TaxID=1314779 RepID=A0A6A6D6K2_9PEZI|nr:hypothetical protein K469DRAFT_703494 [Zopfia rhizophila CBS 207.26]